MNTKSPKERWNVSFQTLKLPIIFVVIFSAVAITLTLLLDNLFYLFNFLYIGIAVALGIFLNTALPRSRKPAGRRVAQLLVGLYMLGYLGLILGENMQMEGFWVYLLSGVFAGATIHYLVAKIFGSVIYNRGWCGWACWTAMILDYLPYKKPKSPPKKGLGAFRYVHFFLSLSFIIIVYLILGRKEMLLDPGWELNWLIFGNIAYYAVGVILAFVTKDNRAFCKYVCPIPVLMKPGARITLLRMQIDPAKCIDCRICEKNCPMSIKLLDYKNKNKRVSSTECIFCNTCANLCPTQAITSSFGIGDKVVISKAKQTIENSKGEEQ